MDVAQAMIRHWSERFYERLDEAYNIVGGRWVCPLCGAGMRITEGYAPGGAPYVKNYDLQCSRCNLNYHDIIQFDPHQARYLDAVFFDFERVRDKWAWFAGSAKNSVDRGVED